MPDPRAPVVDLVYFNAGGGHRAATQALKQTIEQQQRPWTVRPVNLFEVLDPKAQFKKVTGSKPEDMYNKRLAKGWTLGMRQELKMLQATIRLGHGFMLERLVPHWQHTRPDVVVSVVPNFNRALYESVKAADPTTPYMTVMTDLADLPPHFWIEPEQDQLIVCGTPHAAAQARETGYPDARIRTASGMVLRPDFYRPRPAPETVRDQRLAHGLDPRRPTGVVMYGGHGARQMATIARELDAVQLVLMCGHNEALQQELQAMQRSAPQLAVGFTNDVVTWLDLGDFFIGKPGPGSMSEAIQRGLPVATLDNAMVMPQERYNVQWLREIGAGVTASSLRSMDGAVLTLLADLPGWRARADAVQNRAVFEVVEIIAEQVAAANG